MGRPPVLSLQAQVRSGGRRAPWARVDYVNTKDMITKNTPRKSAAGKAARCDRGPPLRCDGALPAARLSAAAAPHSIRHAKQGQEVVMLGTWGRRQRGPRPANGAGAVQVRAQAGAHQCAQCLGMFHRALRQAAQGGGWGANCWVAYLVMAGLMGRGDGEGRGRRTQCVPSPPPHKKWEAEGAEGGAWRGMRNEGHTHACHTRGAAHAGAYWGMVRTRAHARAPNARCGGQGGTDSAAHHGRRSLVGREWWGKTRRGGANPRVHKP